MNFKGARSAQDRVRGTIGLISRTRKGVARL
ncbi:hypothetical protein JOE62_000429 [Glutamicibacter nicotianae]|nr:hypothetical protein [Glutamicibacter nicotianae]